jgi:3-hydroxybutyryl-CoA dehydrogenase
MTTGERVGVVGLGFMGRGIATSLLAHGFEVVALERDTTRCLEATQYIDQAFKDMLTHGILGPLAPSDWRCQFQPTQNIASLHDCTFVIESIQEDLSAKVPLYHALEEHLASQVPIASNTSALPISELQLTCTHPQRLIGMHWGEPCYLTRFLEVIRGLRTDQQTVEQTVALGRKLDKDPAVVERDVDGFIVNRLAYAMYREAFWLLENQVADVETIDRAFSHAISVWANIAGPFRWMDLTGLPAYAAVMQRLFPKLSCDKSLPKLMQDLVDSGAEGVTNGRGFYQYSAEEADQWRRKLEANVLAVRRFHDQWEQSEDR